MKIINLIILFISIVFVTNAQKKIVIDLEDTKMYAFEKENNKWQIIYEFDCVVGEVGSENNKTKEGDFSIGRKYEDYTSQKYQVKMPFAMFYDGPRAIHATDLATIRSYFQKFGLSWWSSHGCVGLDIKDAKILFKWAPLKTSVYVKKKFDVEK